jgi:hypothetical protein
MFAPFAFSGDGRVAAIGQRVARDSVLKISKIEFLLIF